MTPILSQAAEIVKGRKDVLYDNVWHCGDEIDKLFRRNTTMLYQECPANFSGTDEGPSWNKIPTLVSGMPSSLICILRGLSVLENISTMLFEFQHTYHESERLYFSSLESISSISDCILRKLRVVLMVISLECTKVELLEDGKLNSSLKKNKEKLGPSNNKKSRKNRKVKKPNPVPKFTTDDVSLMKSPQVPHYHSMSLFFWIP